MQRATVLGFAFTLLSAVFFAVSGPVAKTFYDIGWSPGSVVLLRLGGAGLIILIPSLAMLRGSWDRARRAWPIIAIYGLVTMAGVQIFFFLALESLDVAVAVLLEMMGAPVLIVFWLWIRHRRQPHPLTGIGILASLAGVLLVLDLIGSRGSWVGVACAVAAAACFACYFLVSSDQRIDLPPLALTGLGMGVGAIATVVLTVTGLLPATFAFTSVSFASTPMSWTVPAALLVLFTVGAYTCGIIGLRLLGPTVGSFVNLSEVPLSAIAAWIILSESLTALQILGTAVIVVGVCLVKIGDLRTTHSKFGLRRSWKAVKPSA
ncbi:EamA family transporter [Brevibacterium linens]|uniref:EamA domain-containing protein n=1 Tax=Brevibacterium linens TaxID=1703 RepID=A0A0B9A5X0_BRELN|nr:DMT family transporter [Brevibacterium linens]KHS50823.1 protein of unknown function DUF6 transmembrane [Brevibacterium linens]